MSETWNQPLPVCSFLRVTGSPYQMGYRRGETQRTEIHRALRRYADVAFSGGQGLLAEDRAYSLEELASSFGQDGADELRGLAEGSGVLLDDLVHHNLSVFPIQITGVSGCVQFAGRAVDGSFVHGANLDVTFSRIVPDALEPTVVARYPEGKIPSVSIVPTGLVGSRGGVNAAGILVATCDLLDEPLTRGPVTGLRRGAAINFILDNADSYEKACSLACEIFATGAKAIGISDLATGRITLSENYGRTVVQQETPVLLFANHSLLLAEHFHKEVALLPDVDCVNTLNTPNCSKLQKNGSEKVGASGDAWSVPTHSLCRFRRLRELLAPNEQGRFALDSEAVLGVLRDDFDPDDFGASGGGSGDSVVSPVSCGHSLFRTMNMILRLDNAWSWLYRERDNRLFICPTVTPWRSESRRNVWAEFDLATILPEWQPSFTGGKGDC